MSLRKKTVVFLPLLMVLSTSAFAATPSFDCTKAFARIEQLICSDPQLSDLDHRLSIAYKDALARSTTPDTLKSDEKAWLANTRNKCQDDACLAQAYQQRLTVLEGIGIVSASPTVASASAIETPIVASSTSAAVAPSSSPTTAVSSANALPIIASTSTDTSIAASSMPLPAVQQASPAESASRTTASSAVEASAPIRSTEVPQTDNSEPVLGADNESASHGHGIVRVLYFVFELAAVALVIVMIRPTLASRFIEVPTRKKIIVPLVICLLIVGLLPKLEHQPSERAKSTQAQTASFANPSSVPHSIETYGQRQLSTALSNARALLPRADDRMGVPGCSDQVANLDDYLNSGGKRELSNLALTVVQDDEATRARFMEMAYGQVALKLNNLTIVVRSYCQLN